NSNATISHADVHGVATVQELGPPDVTPFVVFDGLRRPASAILAVVTPFLRRKPVSIVGILAADSRQTESRPPPRVGIPPDPPGPPASPGTLCVMLGKHDGITQPIRERRWNSRSSFQPAVLHVAEYQIVNRVIAGIGVGSCISDPVNRAAIRRAQVRADPLPRNLVPCLR